MEGERERERVGGILKRVVCVKDANLVALFYFEFGEGKGGGGALFFSEERRGRKN